MEKKKFSAKKTKNQKVRMSQKIIIGIFLLFVFFIIYLYFHYSFLIEEILSEEQIFQQDKIIELETAKDRIAKIVHEPSSPRLIRTFGDSFTSLSRIDRNLTDMYWDFQVSAFLFPPRISMGKLFDCDSKACGYHIQDENWQGFCSQDVCLERRENQLFYNDEILSLPEEINQEKLISISLGGIGNDWYLGFILGKNQKDEEAWIYRFDGDNYHPLINKDTDIEFKIRSGNNNGHLGFGGTKNDLYIVYGGYFGQIKRLINENQLIDLNEFFSLRFTTNGFFPKIQTSPDSQAIYICNTKKNRVNLLKLWKDKEGKVIGSVDLRRLALSELSPLRIDCLPGDRDSDLRIIVETRQGWQKWKMIDNGFNNQIIRQVVSQDINSSNRLVRSAIISSYSINSEKPWHDTFQLFFSTDRENYTPVLPGNWYKIEPAGKSLHWRVIFRNDMKNPYYSPWLNNFSVINYEIIEDND